MNAGMHIDQDRLKKLVSGEIDQHQHEDIIDHVESCGLCQDALEELAATPEFWEKASKMMSGPQIAEDHRTPGEPNLTDDRASDGSDEGDQMRHLLDAPSHPEMMGRIGAYDVEREIGRGAMGVVFKAFDTELNRPLAIKVLSHPLAENGTARHRFFREARAAAAVLHPNIIAIYGVNSSREVPYLVMPFVAGPSLQRLVDEHGSLDEKEVVRIGLQVAAGLSAAHAQGLVHRDIKPANILVEPDVSRVVVTDFGLARAVDDASMTRSGYFVGTPNYMSPEQAMGKRVDARSDLFSLGCVMYFMSTGRLPFRADSPLCVLTRISNDEPTPVLQVNNEISATLSDVINKLLAKDPNHRFQSAGELHDVLERLLAYLHQPDASRPPWIRRHDDQWKVLNLKKIASLAAVLTAAALIYVGSVSVKHWVTSTTPSDAPISSPTTTESFTEEWDSMLERHQLRPSLEVDQIEMEIQLLDGFLHASGMEAD